MSSHSTRFETSDALPAYFRNIDSLAKPLSKEQEKELATRIQLGDEVALNLLVQANLKFVVTLANRFIGMGLPIDDLVQEGNIGLIEAALKFTPEKDVKFITYAQFWIRKKLNYALVEQGKLVKLPMNQEYDLYKRRVAGEDINTSTIAIDKPVSEDDDTTIGDLLLRTDADNTMERSETTSLLDRLLSLLKPTEREIVELFYGIGSNLPMYDDAGEPINGGLSTKQIAAIVEKTPAEVNRALKVARSKMRNEVKA